MMTLAWPVPIFLHYANINKDKVQNFVDQERKAVSYLCAELSYILKRNITTLRVATAMFTVSEKLIMS